MEPTHMRDLTESIAELHSRVYPLHEKDDAPGTVLSWQDDDRSAPKTPWGPAQQGRVIAKGVVLYSTAGHGGLRVSPGAAKLLSDAAKKQAEQWGGAYWYEEDVAINIPFYEVAAWRTAASKGYSPNAWNVDALRKDIEKNFPAYLQLQKDGYKAPAEPKPGETWLFNKPIKFAPGYEFDVGDEVKIIKSSSRLKFVSPKYASVDSFSMTKNALSYITNKAAK